MGAIALPAALIDAGPRSLGMDGIRELLEAARDRGLLTGRFRGILHIVIGRRVTRANGTAVSSGVTWRELAPVLKELRFDRELVREFGANPETLSPRDRERFWYSAISQAHVDTAEASAEADALIPEFKKLGFLIGQNPTAILKSAPKPEKPSEKPPVKGKKK